MSTKSTKLARGGRISRRKVLKTIGGTTAVLAGTAVTGSWKRSFAQSKKVVRIWNLQNSPDQKKAFDQFKKSFESANPNIELAISSVGSKDALAKLTSAFVGGNPPELLFGSNPAFIGSIYNSGKTVPVDDVIKAIGEDDLFPSVRRLFQDKGSYYGIPIGGTAFSTHWYRKSLLKAAGVEPPKDWAESLDVMKKTTAKGIYGHSLTYANGGMTTVVMWVMMRKAGAFTTDADLNVTVNSPETIEAIEYMQALRPYAPPGATTYSFNESQGAFVSGRVANGFYTGRILNNVVGRNPGIADDISCQPWPSKDPSKPFHMNAFLAMFLCNGSKTVDEAKEVMTAWYKNQDSYIDFLNSAPGHMLPVSKSMASAPKYNNHPLLVRYKKELDVLKDEIANGFPRVREGANRPLNLKMGEIMGSGIYAQMLQKVVIDNEKPKAAAVWAHDEIAKIMKG